MISFDDLLTNYSDYIDDSKIGTHKEAHSAKSIFDADTSSIVYALNDKFLQDALNSKAGIILTKSQFREKCDNSDKSFLFTPLPDLLFTKIVRENFYQDIWQKQESFGVHPSAIVDKSVQIPKNSYIGPNVIIGAGCKIGEEVYIGASSYIAENVQIGSKSRIHSLCYIHSHSILGQQCILRSGTVVGSESVEAKLQGEKSEGNCILEDMVETGSNTCIDRAIQGSTIIKRACKLDNLVKISHGVILGEMSLITAGVQIGAKVKTGKYFMIGGNSYVDEAVEICDGVIAGGMSFVDQNITKPGAYGGNPIQEMREYLKTTASLMILPKIRKQLSQINE